jgi:hypothetical protein
MLRKAGMNPLAPATTVDQIYPFLHLSITVKAAGDQLLTNVSVRLFESILLKRVKIEGAVAWQAITWEDDKLVISTAETHEADVNDAVTEIVNVFIKRFLFYQKLKAYMEAKEKRG